MSGIRFTHRTTVIGGRMVKNPHHDRLIYLNGQNIGRAMFYTSGAPGTEHWQWSVGTSPTMSGTAKSLQDCLDELKPKVIALIADGWLPMARPKNLWLGHPMCNLYSNTLPAAAMRLAFDVMPEHDQLGNAPARPAIFPDGDAPIVRIDRDGNRELNLARWGYSKAKFGWVTNARNLGSFPWKHVLQTVGQRCLVPATSFSEYHPTEKIIGGTGNPIKAATWFRLVGNEERPPFAFAGFMRRWNWQKDGLRRKSDQELMDTNAQVIAMAFLTTEPNNVVAPIHPEAMPVLLRTNEEFDTWLQGSAVEAAALQRPLPDDALEIIFTGEKQDAG